MKRLLLATALAVISAPATGLGDEAAPLDVAAHQCGQGMAAPTAPERKAPVMLTGFGTGGFPIQTRSADAQRWFDYGMKQAHAFNHEAATEAFVEASRLDPDCAMCVWGEAWSRGPTINFGIDDKERKQAAELAAKAAKMATGGPERERMLTQALVARYDPAIAKGHDKAFAEAMDKVNARFSEDSEIAILTADAWMIAQGSDPVSQQRAMGLLEGVLARNPDDTGAIHFYIHITEFAGVADRALPYARRLGALAPASGHLVHMPSHTFYRAGLYQAAAEANAKAMEMDKTFISKGGPGQLWVNSYHAHNVTFGLGGAMMSGDGRSALGFAEELETPGRTVTAKDTWPQSYVSTRYFAYGRYADPDKVLKLPEPDARLAYVHAMWRYARGEALARRGDAAGALAEARAMAPSEAELAALGAARADLEHKIWIARGVLEGRAAMLQHRWAAAEVAYAKAAKLQEAQFSNSWDPPSWWYPVRRSLAEAEFMGGRLDQAEADARTVNARWRNDPLTERVLGEIAQARGQSDDDWLARARAHWRGDVRAVKPAQI